MKKIIILFFSILLFIVLNNNQTFACSCMINESPNVSMEKAKSVFIWKVSKIEESSVVNNLIDYRKNYVTFSVSNNIKWNSHVNVFGVFLNLIVIYFFKQFIINRFS